MGKLEPLSVSPRSIRIYSFIILVYFFSNVVCLMQQLPQSGTSRNTPRSRRVAVLLYVTDYGAKGDGLNDDTKAFKDVWKIACSLSSRPKIVIPAGYSFLVRPIHFAGPCRSKVTLRISGSIVAPKNPDVWKGLDRHKWLYFISVKNLIIEGEPCRHAPTAMTFHRCNNLRVRKLMIINSQQMHMAFTNCVRVVASHLRVLAPAASPNTDGIHISASTHVEVKNSIIRTGDDCISIVSNSSSIRVRNIACGPGHGISIGSLGKSKSWTQVHDVRVDGAFFSNTENGVRIKTWQGGSGFASQITFQDLWMENVSNPIIIDQFYCDSRLPCLNQTSAVRVENTSFIRIKGTSATEEAIRFACSDNYPCERLCLEDIELISNSGGITRSFCWEARGSSVGLVYPPPCFSCRENFIEQKVASNPVLQSS